LFFYFIKILVKLVIELVKKLLNNDILLYSCKIVITKYLFELIVIVVDEMLKYDRLVAIVLLI